MYQRKEYTIYIVSDGYVIHNINKTFNKGHTHVRSFHKAKSLIDLAVRKKLPNRPVKWEIESLIRIISDLNFENKLKELGGDVNEF